MKFRPLQAGAGSKYKIEDEKYEYLMCKKIYWKELKASEISDGYNIIYSGRTSTRNCRRVIIGEEIKRKVV